MKKAISSIIAIFLLLYCGVSYASGTVYYDYIEAKFTYIVGETIKETRSFYGDANSEGWLSEPSTQNDPSPVVGDFKWVYDETSNRKHYYSIYADPTIYSRSGNITITGKAAEVGETSIKFSAKGSFYVLYHDCEVRSPVFTIKVIDNNYKVKLNANGGVCQSTSHSVVYNSPYSQKGSLPVPSRAGHTFLGWYTAKTGGSKVTDGTLFLDRNAVINKRTVTLYARWAPITYEVSYYGNANGVTNVPAAQTKIWGEDLAITAAVPKREGYAFRGWGTDPYDSDVSFKPGDFYKNNAPIKLYAKWMLKTYTVAFDGNGENVTNIPLEEYKLHGMDINIPDNVPVREDAIFLGWSTAADSVTAEYQPGDAFSLNEDATLYAVWDTDYFTVTYDANGGIGAPEAQKKSQNQQLFLSSVVPTREGHNFRGWAKSAGATEAVYQPGEEFSDNADTTLYAVWTPMVYTVTYQANGGSGAPAAQSKNHGQALTLRSEIPTRAGYRFLGWAKSAAATVAAYQAGGSFNENANTTLYAVWTRITYTVSYNANGGSGAPAAQSKTHGQALTLSGSVPTRKGFIFLGWAETKTAWDAAYQPGGSFTKDVDSTLYAVWLAPDLVLPASLTRIDDEAFVGGAFRYAKLSEAVTTIGSKAFANCPKLEYIYIPETVTNINQYAFDGVNDLTIIGVSNSYAEFFAIRYGFDFRAIATGN